MDKNIRIICVSALTLLGIMCITSGVMYSKLQSNNIEEKILVVVEQKRVSTDTDVNIKLKDLTIEVNTPLSVKIVDYLETAVSDEVLANLKLDTSSVNVTQTGTYNYTVTYKKKKYNGIIIVKEKQVTNNTLQSITLKTLKFNIGTPLSTDISNYIIEPLTEEIKSTMIIDLSNVNVNKAGSYQYTIKYNNSIYTGTITITESQPTLSTTIGDNQENTEKDNTNETNKADTTSKTN